MWIHRAVFAELVSLRVEAQAQAHDRVTAEQALTVERVTGRWLMARVNNLELERAALMRAQGIAVPVPTLSVAPAVPVVPAGEDLLRQIQAAGMFEEADEA